MTHMRGDRSIRGARSLRAIEGEFQLSIEMPAYYEFALCAQVDNDIFFPEKGGSTKDAKKVCLGCPVINDCLEHALAADERFGLWGGKSERERRKIKRLRERELEHDQAS